MSIEARLKELRRSREQAPPAPLQPKSDDLESRLVNMRASNNIEQPPVQKESDPWYEDFGEGLVASGLGTYYGVKDLVFGMDDEDRATLEDWRQDAAESGWGTAGEITGEIAQLALPAGAITKGAKALNTGKLLSKAIPVAGDIAASAGLGYLKAPTDDMTRAERAEQEATGAMLGSAFGGVLNKALRGLKVTPEAQALMDKGVYLPPDKAVESKFIQGIGNTLDVTPFFARASKEAKERAVKEFNEVALQEAAPKGFKITSGGQEGFNQLKSAFTQAYSDAWKGADSLTNASKVKFVDTAANAAESMSAQEIGVLKRVMSDFRNLSYKTDSDSIKSLDNVLRKEFRAALKDPTKAALRDTMEKLRADLRSGIPNNVADKLKEVDGQYGKYLVNQKATADAAAEAGAFQPKQLLKAAKTVGGESRTAQGRSPLQDIAYQGVQTIDRSVGGQPLEWFRRLASATPTLLPMQALGEVSIGNTKAQKAALEAAEALRRYGISGGTIGAGLTGLEEQ